MELVLQLKIILLTVKIYDTLYITIIDNFNVSDVIVFGIYIKWYKNYFLSIERCSETLYGF